MLSAGVNMAFSCEEAGQGLGEAQAWVWNGMFGKAFYLAAIQELHSVFPC